MNNKILRNGLVGALFLTGILPNTANASDFIINGCGEETILDQKTDLCWDSNMNRVTEGKNYYEAADYCEKLTHAGHTNWKLPTEEQLLTLTDRTHDWMICDGLESFGFQNCQLSSYWTIDRYDSDKVAVPLSTAIIFGNNSIGKEHQVKGYGAAIQGYYDFVCVRKN